MRNLPRTPFFSSFSSILALTCLTLGVSACSDDSSTEGSSSSSSTSASTETGTETTGEEDGDSVGDGDGDPAGDGDGDTAGDGDGDGNTAGDGDGDTAGDGDGDTAGDGDGDPLEDADMDGYPADVDCDDDNPDIHPDADEICDGLDNNCDEEVDVGAIDEQLFYTDADMDGYGVGEGSPGCEQPPDTASVAGDCNDNDPNAYPGQDDICALGQTCKAIYDSGVGVDDGLYLIDPDGVDVGEAPLEVWCDMANEGVTAALIINSVIDGVYIGDFGAGYVSTSQLAVDPATTSSPMATAVQTWLDLNEYPFENIRLAAYSDGVNTYTSEWIAAGDLRVAFGEPGYLLWEDPNGYYWCGGAASYTDAGEGQINPPQGAPADCKGHGSLGSGWDFSETDTPNQGLTLCGGDASAIMYRNYGANWLSYPNPGASYVIWAR